MSLPDFADRSLVFAAMDFPSELGALIPNLADEFYKSKRPDDVTFVPGVHYVFKWYGSGKIMILSHNRFGFQSLGLKVWRDNIAELGSLSERVAGALQLETVKRIGLKIQAFLPQSMTHGEIGNLFFGTYLQDAERFAKLGQELNDPIIQFEGTRDERKFTANLTAVNQDQLRQAIASTPNLEHFGKGKSLDPILSSFVERVAGVPAIFCDIDLYAEQLPRTEISSFYRTSTDMLEDMVTTAANIVLGKM